MTCDRCKSIHDAQAAGLTQLPCGCVCHNPVRTSPTVIPWTNNPFTTCDISLIPTANCTTTFTICPCIGLHASGPPCQCKCHGK